MAEAAKPIQLNADTLAAFELYVRKAEEEMNRTLLPSGVFLWSDAEPNRGKKVREGEVIARFWSGKEPAKVPRGLIHDWIGAAFIPGSTLDDTLSLMQDYENHKTIFSPEVIDSKLINRKENDFQIYLRLLKKKILTVVLDTDHDVRYRPVSRTRWECRSYTTRVAEVENAGKPDEKVLPGDTGYGFLWRLYSYWRLEERDAGVYVECRAISLTRDIPFGLGWVIEPIIQQLPKDSLISTLEATRRGVTAKAKS